MVLLDNIIESITKNIDVSKKNTVAKMVPAKKTILNEVLEKPENFFLIAYIDNNDEIVARIRKKGIINDD